MERQFKEIDTDAKVRLFLAACDCEGYSISEEVNKSRPFWDVSGCCTCGLRKAKKKLAGGWSVIRDTEIFNPHRTISSSPPFSITGQPDH